MKTTTRLAQLPTIKLIYVIRYFDSVGRQLGQSKISYSRPQTATAALPSALQSARKRNSNICRGEVVCVYA
jgi:hypothetical protein